MTTRVCDLLIVGGGPAGLSAAINGASEGLNVCILDAAGSLGGQAKESSRIENYPLPAGHEDGVSGSDLMTGFVQQAKKFATQMFCPVVAERLTRQDDHLVVTTSDYDEYAARAVLLSNGLSYRRHGAEGIGALMGRGVYYGLPSALPKSGRVVVVGGANSAGQAVLKLASNPKLHVTLVIRKRIEDQMSTYLIERIKAASNVYVRENTSVVGTTGNGWLQTVELDRGDKSLTVQGLYVFIGASPRTLWLNGTLDLDDRKYVVTDRGPLSFETSMPGVFAGGDVRSGSVKRIASAIGEGAVALQSIHRYLAAKE